MYTGGLARRHPWGVIWSILELSGTPGLTLVWNLSKAETVLLCFQFQENTISCLKEADFVSTHNDLHRPLVSPLSTQERTSEAELINTMLNDEKLRNVANLRPRWDKESPKNLDSSRGWRHQVGPGQALFPSMASVSSSAQGHSWVGWPQRLLSLLHATRKSLLAINILTANTQFPSLWVHCTCACARTHTHINNIFGIQLPCLYL